MKSLLKLKEWVSDDWSKIISPHNYDALEKEIIWKNLQRCKIILIILIFYEPISLFLMFAGYTQTLTIFYTVPTIAIIAISAPMLIYCSIAEKDKEKLKKSTGVICYIFLIILVTCISIMIIADITQYGQNFLNFMVALGVACFVPILRFKQSVVLSFIPFAAFMLGVYFLMNHTVIIEPVVLFIVALVIGNWISKTVVVSENNRLDLELREEQLRASEERYKLALENSGSIFFFFDVPRRTVFFSDDFSQTFDIPNKIGNIPESIIEGGYLDADSEDAYREFYKKIFDGIKSGEVIISHHLKQADEMLWCRLAFTSVFDANGNPLSAIITLEDLTDDHRQALENEWKQLSLRSVNEEEYTIIEYDLTRDKFISQSGKLFSDVPKDLQDYDKLCHFATENLVHDEDKDLCKKIFDKENILELYRKGIKERCYELRTKKKGNEYRWTQISVQSICDPYSKNILVQFLFKDINEEKTGIVKLEKNMEELRQELEQSRIRVMINQMQPHFLYNALSAIQTIIMFDQKYASQLVYDFTVHLRSSIRALQSDEPIPLTEELKNVKAYLNIEQMRFGDSLKVNYEIECDTFKVIPLSIQPLAENAARHGIFPKGEEGGIITIKAFETESAYIVKVEDDGKGFDVKSILENKESDSVGLKNLIYRLKALMDADVTVDSKIGTGTTVIVTIPKES